MCSCLFSCYYFLLMWSLGSGNVSNHAEGLISKVRHRSRAANDPSVLAITDKAPT